MLDKLIVTPEVSKKTGATYCHLMYDLQDLGTTDSNDPEHLEAIVRRAIEWGQITT